MFGAALPDKLEAAVVSDASCSGPSVSVNEYVAAELADAPSLETDRSRLDSFLSGTPGVSHERARTWLSDLAAGQRTERIR
jgi:hypothetical protein